MSAYTMDYPVYDAAFYSYDSTDSFYTSNQSMHPIVTNEVDFMQSGMNYAYNTLPVMSTTCVDYSSPMLLEPMSPCYSTASPVTSHAGSYSPESDIFQFEDEFAPICTSSHTSENQCPYSDCQSKGKFKRKTDLNRHIKTQHEADQNMIDCKHGWCGRTGTSGFTREDHLREHLREVHRENIPYKTHRKYPSSSKSSRKENKLETFGEALRQDRPVRRC